MTIRESIDRLYWRLKNGTWKPNQNDVDAVNELVTYVNNSKKQDIKENILFTKMYVFCFRVFLEKYKEPNLAQNELHRIICKPTLQLYKEFQETINRIEFENFCDLVGVELLEPTRSYQEEKEFEEKVIQEHKAEFLRHVKGQWDFDEIRVKLNNQVSEAYNKYHQKK